MSEQAGSAAASPVTAPQAGSAPAPAGGAGSPIGSRIFLLGLPGAGKTTLARMLESTAGARYVSSSSLLRASQQYGQQMEQFTSGRMPDPHVIAGLVSDKLRHVGPREPVVVDGFPRTWSQYLALGAHYPAGGLGLAFVWVEVEIRLAIQRLEWRRACRQCGRPTPRTNTSARCLECGGEIFRRPDDSSDDAVARINSHARQLADLQRRMMKIRSVCCVDGAQPPHENVARIVAFAAASTARTLKIRNG
jgi:adenylate kinase family enzyme